MTLSAGAGEKHADLEDATCAACLPTCLCERRVASAASRGEVRERLTTTGSGSGTGCARILLIGMVEARFALLRELSSSSLAWALALSDLASQSVMGGWAAEEEVGEDGEIEAETDA